MSSSADLAGLNKTKLHLGDFAQRFAGDAIPFGPVFSYFSAAVTFGHEELKDYVEEPIAALPPSIVQKLGKVVLLFVPFIEKPVVKRSGGKRHASRALEFNPADSLVAMDPPIESARMPFAYLAPQNRGDAHILAFGVRGMDSSEFHYNFFYSIASILFLNNPDAAMNGYANLLRDELKLRAHGEVDEPSWTAKLELLKRQTGVRGETKLFREYARNSFIDSMTLYLHGICCDIDVEPGPRQIASRYLRKRLQYLQGQFPQPEGYAVFPEELQN